MLNGAYFPVTTYYWFGCALDLNIQKCSIICSLLLNQPYECNRSNMKEIARQGVPTVLTIVERIHFLLGQQCQLVQGRRGGG